MHSYYLIYLLISLGYTIGNQSEKSHLDLLINAPPYEIDGPCLTNQINGTFTKKKWENLINRRKIVHEIIQSILNRDKEDTLLTIKVIFHNVYHMENEEAFRSFCDYESGYNESAAPWVYSSKNDSSICYERANTALTILNEQFSPANIQFIEHPDTSLIIDNIVSVNNRIKTNNFDSLKLLYNIPNALNIYLDYCMRNSAGICYSSKRGWATYPDNIDSNTLPGITIRHSSFPGINEKRIGVLAHEIGHVFNLLHLYHKPGSIINNLLVLNPEFRMELVSGNECSKRGDTICDTPGQPLNNVIEAFDTDECIYHGFGGEYNATTKILKIGGYNQIGPDDLHVDSTLNAIGTINQDSIGEYWGTRELPDTCFLPLPDQGQYATACPDSLYQYKQNRNWFNSPDTIISSLPSAINFLQVPNINDACLQRGHLGYTQEQFANIRYSIEHDYTGCNKMEACNYDSLSYKFFYDDSLCKFPCMIQGGCTTTDTQYESDYSQYNCMGTSLSLTKALSPAQYVIDKIYPNPFNPITTIYYQLEQNINVTITIYDLNGRLITILTNNFQSAGYHSINWNAAEYASGIYFVHISTNQINQTHKILLIK